MALLVSNVAEFNSKILAWGKMHESGISMSMIVRKLILDGLVSVTNYTPVDTGYLRYNWTVTIGRPKPEGQAIGNPKSSYPSKKNVPTEGDFSREAGKLSKAGFNIHYIQNNASYSEAVNNGSPTIEAKQMIQLAMGDLIMSVNESGVMAV
tara:strand:- start:28 stop:480 length:453 start_codon:yes stop_codon:yes gene_type:complete